MKNLKNRKQQKFSDEMLNDPVVRAKLQNFIESGIELVEQILVYKESYNDLAKTTVEEIGIPKRVLNRVVKRALLYKKNLEKIEEEKETERLVENIVDFVFMRKNSKEK